jgi:hypothetical protein
MFRTDLIIEDAYECILAVTDEIPEAQLGKMRYEFMKNQKSHVT